MISESTSSAPRRISIAIDGPAGAGKSTTARLLASELGYVYVDSGAMYRVVALKCLEDGVDESDPATVANVASRIEIAFQPSSDASGEQTVLSDGVDVTKSIRNPQISQLASSVSTIPKVREILVAKQRAMGEAGGVVMEGRDIGTVVLPDAEVKIFLTASLDERAARRYHEMQQKGATDVSFEQVREDIAERDYRDTTRAVSPLKAAEDARVLDSEMMDARQVVDAILNICGMKITT